MDYIKMNLPASNRFAADYMNGELKKGDFFQYDWRIESDIAIRAERLESKAFPREETASYIEGYMERFGISDRSRQNIEALKNGALVVIGGQQAGLLTGPLYSIHKVISIIKLAKEQSEKLGKQVVPVFWIAGEDHDYNEVNHVYVDDGSSMQKMTYPGPPTGKRMVSDIKLDRDLALEWAESVFAELGETDRTNLLMDWVENAISRSETFTDFFACLINDLFNDTGLLLVDSGDPQFRKMAAPYYRQIAFEGSGISKEVLKQQAILKEAGYKPIIDVDEACCNLFYYEPTTQNRILLERQLGADQYVGKGSNITFTEAELDRLLSKTPENFSTNVVTRPLLQEKIFPVLGFIGGPGEIAYWSEIMPVFRLLGEEMPPVWPRLSFTLVEGAINRLLDELDLSIEEVLSQGCSAQRDAFLKELRENVPNTYTEIINSLEKDHRKWQKEMVHLEAGLEPLFEKNRQILVDQLLFMQKKIEEQLARKNADTIGKYNRVENSLKPVGGLQERIWNPFYFFNHHGSAWVDALLEENLAFDGSHYVIYL